MESNFVPYGYQRILTIAKTGEVYQIYSNSGETEAYIANPETGKKHGTIRKNKKLENAKNNASKARKSTTKAKENKADKSKAKEHLKSAEEYLAEVEKDLADCPFADTVESARKAQEAVKKAEESDDENFSADVDDADQKTEDAANKAEESHNQSFTVYDENEKETYDIYSTELVAKDDGSVWYLDPETGVIKDSEGNQVSTLTDKQPGPGSDDLTFLDKYTYRQLLGLNDVLADMCQDIKVYTNLDLSEVNAPPTADIRSNLVASFTVQGTEYFIIGDTDMLNRVHLLKRTEQGIVYDRAYQVVGDASREGKPHNVFERHFTYNKDKDEWEEGATELKYVLKGVKRSDGKISYWEIFKIGVASAFAALTPPLPLTSRYEDCEERLKNIYSKNNNKTSTTAATAVEASEPKTWNWPSAQVTFASLSGAGVVASTTATSSSSSSSNSSWSWVNKSKLKALAEVKKSPSSPSSGSSLAEKAKSALGAVSELGKKMVAFFNKDAKTAKGEEMNKEEPLSVPDMSKETQALAVASKTTAAPLLAQGAREAVLISNAIERQKVAYGKGRQSYQQEHQAATEIRKTRMQYRQANIAYCINMGAGSTQTA